MITRDERETLNDLITAFADAQSALNRSTQGGEEERAELVVAGAVLPEGEVNRSAKGGRRWGGLRVVPPPVEAGSFDAVSA